MKIKQIIGAILMVVMTILGVVLSILISLSIILNSNTILKAVNNTNYLEKSKEAAKDVFLNYLPEDKVEEILTNISVKADIKTLIEAIDTNSIKDIAKVETDEVKGKIIAVLGDEITEDIKDSFATKVSNEYIKTIFPVTEFSVLGKFVVTYISKIITVAVAILVIITVIYIYLACGKKTYKWAIIAIYNIIILSIIFVIALNVLDGIAIGNKNVTLVILELINLFRLNVVYISIVWFVIVIISNYIAYFRKRKHKSNK